jgi:hypothetical protein
MKGTDLTAEQLAAAKAFLLEAFASERELSRTRVRARVPLDTGQKDTGRKFLLCTLRDLVHLVAWYGALRYESALRRVSQRTYTREDFPVPSILPKEIREQILADEGLLKPSAIVYEATDT